MADGIPREVGTNEILDSVYRADAIVRAHPVGGCPQMILVPGFREGQGEDNSPEN